MTYYIYALKDDTGKIKYVGQTIHPDVRKSLHRRKKPKHTFHIIDNINDRIEARDMEIRLIEENDCYIFGWNGTPGGEGFEGYSRKGIGGGKKGHGRAAWNRGVKGCFSKKTIAQMSAKRKGVRHSSKVDIDTVRKIRKLYNDHPHIDGVGKIQRNGIAMSYVQGFCKTHHNDYGITLQGLKRIVLNETWENV
jgi:hypothetical protein